MISLANYEARYYDDVVVLVEMFYRDFLKEFDPGIVRGLIDEWIVKFSGPNARNSFLMIHDGKCVGVIAGQEIRSPLNDKRIFQEVFWFMADGFGRYITWFINSVRARLKENGFDMFIMAVLDSPKAERVKSIYESMGFRLLETHYMREL